MGILCPVPANYVTILTVRRGGGAGAAGVAGAGGSVKIIFNAQKVVATSRMLADLLTMTIFSIEKAT